MKTAKATLHLVSTQALHHRTNLEAVLDAIERAPRFVPSTWGLEERQSLPYSREAVVARIDPKGLPLPQASLHLRRKAPPSYAASLSLWERSVLNFDVYPSHDDYPYLFALADTLADATRPDFAVVHIWLGLRADDDEPWSDDDERDWEMMMYAGNLLPVSYYKRGPAGLAFRTYIGPHYVEQLGVSRIESLPLSVEKQQWGGYRIDLVREPWAADASRVLEAWRRGMEHLSDAEVFAVPDFSDNQIEFTKNQRTVITSRAPRP